MRQKPGRPVEKILAENVRALMDANKMTLGTQPKVAKATKGKLDQTTIGRVLAAKHRVQIDTLQALAEAFNLEPYQLLIPDLDAKNPQAMRSLSQTDERIFKVLDEARRGGSTQ
jgi:transcriptional regulator with XRE-family HTH domain